MKPMNFDEYYEAKAALKLPPRREDATREQIDRLAELRAALSLYCAEAYANADPGGEQRVQDWLSGNEGAE